MLTPSQIGEACRDLCEYGVVAVQSEADAQQLYRELAAPESVLKPQPAPWNPGWWLLTLRAYASSTNGDGARQPPSTNGTAAPSGGSSAPSERREQRAQPVPRKPLRLRLMQRSGTSPIELLVVLATISSLLLVAVPRFGRALDRAAFAGLKSELKNLALQQEVQHVLFEGYTDDLAQLGFTPSPNLLLSIELLPADEPAPQAWVARATYRRLRSPGGCVIYAGDIEPPRTPLGRKALQPTVPTCDE